MDTRTGEIASLDAWRGLLPAKEFKAFVRPIDTANLSEPARESLETTGRAVIGLNSRCACGSGKKFKRCCLQRPKP